MMRVSKPLATLGLVFLVDALTAQSKACEGIAPWSRLPSTAEHTASPLPLSLVAGAVAAPLIMAPTGADYQLRLVSQRDLHGRPNAESISVYTPFVLPLVLVGVDVVAISTNQCETARPTSAMMQAMGVTLRW